MLQVHYKLLLPLSVLSALIGLLIVGACAPLYIPTATHTSTFDSAGQAEAAGYFSTSGFDVQAAYSPIDHLMVAGAFSFSPGEDDLTIPIDHSHVYGELLTGIYTPIGKRWSTHFLGGFGVGEATYRQVVGYDTVTQPITVRTKGTYERIMAQHYLAYKPVLVRKLHNGKVGVVELGIANRIALADFYHLARADTLYADRSALYWEMVGVIKIGNKDALFELQTGPVRRLDGDEPELGLTHWWQWNMGLRIKL